MNNDIFFLENIQVEIEFLEEQFPKSSKEELINNPVLQRAALRSLEIISDSVKYLSKKFKADNPHMEWRDIEEMGNGHMHPIFATDWDIVYEIVLYGLPGLKETVIMALR
jgi:uncharacterized protein with HEPN domain